MNKTKEKTEYGDWQTPTNLAQKICSLLASQGFKPESVIEPTCGKGSFLIAALKSFPTIKHAIGIEINKSHIKTATETLSNTKPSCKIELIQADFFKFDWNKITSSLAEPILIIGNPPWVTNSKLTALGSANLPRKSNFQNHRGIDAITGKSNFDISEWMLSQMLDWIENRRAVIAMLCKTAIARKVLVKAWQNNHKIKTSGIYNIDASAHFGAAVDASLVVIPSAIHSQNTNCRIFDSLNQKRPSNIIGYQDNLLVSNVAVFEQHKHLINKGKPRFIWRSGVKHDCSRVMELKEVQKGLYRNGFGEIVELEEDFLYPMLKSSDLAKGPPFNFTKKMLITQRYVGENTGYIKNTAPKTWRYLNVHSESLDNRASTIYCNQPRFSVFGVGDYSFAEWKVAISGFYKSLNFSVVGPLEEKPVVLDDTCYFIGRRNKDEAYCLAEILNSKVAREFFSSLIFWDSKRPITTGLLNRLDITALAQELNLNTELCKYHHPQTANLQLSLWK